MNAGAILQTALLVLLPPLLLGVVTKTKAFFAGRVGPPLLQPYFDLWKLAQKGLVLSTQTTWVFRVGPIVALAAVFAAGLLVPIGRAAAPIAFTGDLILFVYLLGLARFFTTAAALDTGSAFEGMGVSRELTFACLTEPALFFALLMLARISGSFDLAGILHGPEGGFTAAVAAPLVLAALGLFIVLLAECSRVPVDDPATHLELTMIHEVMVLDHSGPLLGAALYTAALKLYILAAVLIHVVSPSSTGAIAIDGAFFVAKMIALAIAIGVLESMTARLRMKHVPYLLVGAALASGFGFLLLVR